MPDCFWINANGQYLPHKGRILRFDSAAYGIFVNFDAKVKKDVALEMIRALKPGGSIPRYGFARNPTNPQTKGFRLKETKALFSG